MYNCCSENCLLRPLLLRISHLDVCDVTAAHFMGRMAEWKGVNPDKCHQCEFLLRIPPQSRTDPRSGCKYCQLQHTHSYQGSLSGQAPRQAYSVCVGGFLNDYTHVADHTKSQSFYSVINRISGTKTHTYTHMAVAQSVGTWLENHRVQVQHGPVSMEHGLERCGVHFLYEPRCPILQLRYFLYWLKMLLIVFHQ